MRAGVMKWQTIGDSKSRGRKPVRSSAAVASVYAWEALDVLRERRSAGAAAWTTAYLVMDVVLGILQLANVPLGIPAVLMIGLLIRLAHPVGLFVEAIKSFEPPAIASK